MSRTSMRDLVAIGQTWRRRRDGQLARVRQVHRPDRLTELELTDPSPPRRTVLLVAFSDLRTKWRPANPTSEQRSTR